MDGETHRLAGHFSHRRLQGSGGKVSYLLEMLHGLPFKCEVSWLQQNADSDEVLLQKKILIFLNCYLGLKVREDIKNLNILEECR
jgi:hypothetical protein